MVAFSPAAYEAFLAETDETPVVMLNLIRFDPQGGRDRYLQYIAMAKPILARFGARILFGGNGLPVLTEGQAQPWDAVVLVEYPRRAAFNAMVAIRSIGRRSGSDRRRLPRSCFCPSSPTARSFEIL